MPYISKIRINTWNQIESGIPETDQAKLDCF